MASKAELITDLEALKIKISAAEGVSTISLDGRSLTYQSLELLYKQRTSLELAIEKYGDNGWGGTSFRLRSRY